MNLNVMVLAGNSDFGLASKETRGIVPDQGEMPSSLQPMKATLQRFATRLGIDLEGPVKDIAQRAEQAMRAKLAAPAPAVPSVSHGLAP